MKMTKKKYIAIFCLPIIFLLLHGCEDHSREHILQQHINELKAKATEKEMNAKGKLWQLPTAVIYHPDGYSGTEANSAKNNAANPLQAYPLKDLKFAGTLTENNKISAYVMTPDNMIYLVKVGDVIGEDYGKIVKIDSDHLAIAMPADKQSKGQMVTMELKDSQ